MSEQTPTATPSASVVATDRVQAEKAAAAPAQSSAPIPAAPTPAPAPDMTEEVMRAVARQIESYLKANGRDLEFRVDQATGRTVITVRDSSTGEVIRQIPDAEALRIAQALGKQPNALIDLSI
jgi:flagellar protein FlaG